MEIALFFLLLCSLNSFGQKAIYSHQTVRRGYQDVVQLVADVSSHHHLLLIRPEKTPHLYIYDESLKLVGKKVIPVSISNNCDVQILPFKGHYFFYTHLPKTSKYQFLKIDDKGNVKDMLPVFQSLVDSNLKDSGATVQIMADKSNLYIRTQVYYSKLSKLKISLVKADTMLNVSAANYVFIPFDAEKEHLQHVSILDKEHLLILKRISNEDSENMLEVMKCSLKSNQIDAIQFNVNYSLFSQPAIHFNKDDSTIIIYSMIRESMLNQGYHRSLFMCKLNYSLQPIGQVVTLKTSNLSSFFLINESKMNWLPFIDTRLNIYSPGSAPGWGGRQLSGYYSYPLYNYKTQQRLYGEYLYNNEMIQMPDHQYQNKISNRNRSRIKFTILDKQFKVVSDSVLLNDDKGMIIHVANFGKFRLKNRNYLIMEQLLPKKSTGLLLISGKGDNKIDITDLPVYNRYNYFLSQSRLAGDGNVVFPYINKEQVGLVKLKFD